MFPAALSVRSQTADPGFRVRTVYPMSLPYNNDPAKSNALRQREIEQLEAIPEVQSVALVDYVPLTATWTTQVAVLNTRAAPGIAPSETLARHVSPTYFNTLGIPIVRGRNFTREETQSGAGLAIVSTAMARHAWPEEDSLGKKIKVLMSWTKREWSVFEVVGVAGEVRSENISRPDPVVSWQ